MFNIANMFIKKNVGGGIDGVVEDENFPQKFSEK